MSKRKATIYTTLGVRKKRVYTMTTAQYVVGFVISISFSMLLGPLLERYAPRYLQAAAFAVSTIHAMHSKSSATQLSTPVSTTISTPRASGSAPVQSQNPYDELRHRVRQLSQSQNVSGVGSS